MKSALFFACILAVFLLMFTADTSSASCPSCNPAPIWNSSQVWQEKGIENHIERLRISSRMESLEVEDKALYAALHIGGVYDTHIGLTTEHGEFDKDDAGFSVKAGLGYQFPFKGNFGFRTDYSGYVDVHRGFLDIQEHHFSIEPQYAKGPFICSLLLGITYKLEDGQTDANLKSISPFVTYVTNTGTGAAAIYGLYARIKDKDDDLILNENGTSYGAGVSYIYFFKKLSSARFSIDYSDTDYNASVRDYGINPDLYDKRKDRVLTSSLNLRLQVTTNFAYYATYYFIHSDSNVEIYDHNRQILKAGIIFNY